MAGNTRLPDWNLSVLDTDTQEKGQIGVAWTNDDGSIGIKLNPWTQLQSKKSLQIRLFKNTGAKTSSKPQRNDPDTPF